MSRLIDEDSWYPYLFLLDETNDGFATGIFVDSRVCTLYILRCNRIERDESNGVEKRGEGQRVRPATGDENRSRNSIVEFDGPGVGACATSNSN